MKKGRNAVEISDGDNELDDMELLDAGREERTLVLKAAPPSRRVQLIAHGAKEIRCAWCDHIKPLAGAEEAEDGWICEDCMPEIMKGPKDTGSRGKRYHNRGSRWNPVGHQTRT